MKNLTPCSDVIVNIGRAPSLTSVGSRPMGGAMGLKIVKKLLTKMGENRRFRELCLPFRSALVSDLQTNDGRNKPPPTA